MSNQPKFYAGIGSRNTPENVLIRMRKLALVLADFGYTLRSGGAAGADTAFASLLTADQREIFVPWPGFNSIDPRFTTDWNFPMCTAIAAAHHPAWGRCSPAAQKLHARNVAQILGPIPGVSQQSEFVVCWADGSAYDKHGNICNVAGGTGQAVRIAYKHYLPIFNLALEGHDRLLWEHIKAHNDTRDEAELPPEDCFDNEDESYC